MSVTFLDTKHGEDACYQDGKCIGFVTATEFRVLDKGARWGITATLTYDEMCAVLKKMATIPAESERPFKRASEAGILPDKMVYLTPEEAEQAILLIRKGFDFLNKYEVTALGVKFDFIEMWTDMRTLRLMAITPYHESLLDRIISKLGRVPFTT